MRTHHFDFRNRLPHPCASSFTFTHPRGNPTTDAGTPPAQPARYSRRRPRIPPPLPPPLPQESGVARLRDSLLRLLTPASSFLRRQVSPPPSTTRTKDVCCQGCRRGADHEEHGAYWTPTRVSSATAAPLQSTFTPPANVTSDAISPPHFLSSLLCYSARSVSAEGRGFASNNVPNVPSRTVGSVHAPTPSEPAPPPPCREPLCHLI